MKKILLFLVAMFALLPGQMEARDFQFAYEGQTLTYTVLDEDSKTVKTKEGSSKVGGNNVSGRLILPSVVSDGESSYTLVQLGNLAFRGCTGLTELTIPNTVTSIGNNVFRDCTGLTELTIPNTVTSIGNFVFQGCTGLTELTIPNTVTSIGDGIFYGCTGLTELTIPNTITSIGAFVFYRCTGLTEVIIPNTVTSIGNSAFYGCTGLAKVIIPNSVTSIGDYAFRDCAGLTEVIIPNTVTSIGDYAFDGCTGLKKSAYPSNLKNPFLHEAGTVISYSSSTPVIYEDGVLYNEDHTEIYFVSLKLEGGFTIPNTVTSIGDYTFSGCTGLTKVLIPDTITSIGDGIFSGCTGLTEVIIPNTVTSIGDYTFSGCTGLTKFLIPNTVTSIGYAAFYGCTGLTEIIIPNMVTFIGIYAFDGCTGLTEIIIPNAVTSIGNAAFRGCTGLTEVVIPNSVITLGLNSFAESSSLASLTLGSGLTKIPTNAFKGCALTELILPSNITTIGANAFEGNKLTNVTMGCNVAQIGTGAFASNDDIATINITAKEPPVATDDVFSTRNAQLNVLKESREAYEKALCWHQFKGVDLVPISVFEILNESVPESRAVSDGLNQIQFTVRVEPANASLKDYIFWSSSNPEVATVDNKGLVTLVPGVKGEAKITAHTLYDGVVSSATVTNEGVSGIDDVYSDNSSEGNINRSNDIYNLQGICLKRNSSQADIDALAPGLYIIGGKKVFVR